MTSPPREVSESERVLGDAGAGGKAIRGGAMRVAGYGASMALTAVGSIALLRYLGVDDFGRYATVTAIIAIVQGLTDAGLNVVGQREFVLRRTAQAQSELVADVLGIRLVTTPIGVAAAVLFAALVGYDSAMVAGTALAGCGVIVGNAATAYTLPLSATLRLGWVTVVDAARQAAIVVGILLLVLVGAALQPFFATQILGAAAALSATWIALRSTRLPRPRFSWARWRPLLVAAAPVAASLVLNVVYLRTLLVMMSLLATERATGQFATSLRVTEVFLGLPLLIVGAAFPILVHAGAENADRLVYAMGRLTEASLVIATALVLVLVVAAEPVILVLGGSAYEGVIPVLRLQALVLLPAFMTQVAAFGLVSLHRQRAVIVINAVALATVLVLGVLLIPPAGAMGAAGAAVAGETALALTAWLLLVRARRSLRPRVGPLLRIGVAAALGVAVAMVPGVPPIIAGLLALAVFTAAAWLVGALPDELVQALRRRDA